MTTSFSTMFLLHQIKPFSKSKIEHWNAGQQFLHRHFFLIKTLLWLQYQFEHKCSFLVCLNKYSTWHVSLRDLWDTHSFDFGINTMNSIHEHCGGVRDYHIFFPDHRQKSYKKWKPLLLLIIFEHRSWEINKW